MIIKHILTEYQRYEQNRLNISMTESHDAFLGRNLEQNKTTFNF